MREREIVEGTESAIIKLRSVEEFTTQPVNPDVAEFSRFLADRLNPRIVPVGFLTIAELSLYDLQKGVDGYTGEAIKSNLVGRDPRVYNILRANLPGLARIAFSEQFADAVEDDLGKMMEMFAEEKTKEPQQKIETPPDPDVIQSPIMDISQARHQIIDDAINRTLALDWVHFGVTDLVEARKILDVSSVIVLRQSDMNFELNILDTHRPDEASILESLPSDHKSQLTHKRFWLVMFDTLPPEEATFMRDWLWVKAPEPLAGFKELPIKTVLTYFAKTAPAWEKAAFRLAQYMPIRGKYPIG